MTEQQQCSNLPEVQLPSGDMLRNMWNSQIDFQSLLDNSFHTLVSGNSSSVMGSHDFGDNPSITSEERAKRLSYNILALHAELTETLEWLPWKNWKTYPAPFAHTDVVEAQYEAIDCLHFLINIMALLGMTPDMVYDGFMRKQQENRNRQERGY